LERKLSPWKERVAGRWQRRLVTTDSSAEQSLEVGCFVRFRRARTSAHLGGCRRSAKGNPGFGRGLGTPPPGDEPGSLQSDPYGQSQLGGGFDRPPRRRRFGTGTAGRFRKMKSTTSVAGDVDRAMTWGSASADRSIIESGSLPRTPVNPLERACPPTSRAGQPALFTASSARSSGTGIPTSSEEEPGSTQFALEALRSPDGEQRNRSDQDELSGSRPRSSEPWERIAAVENRPSGQVPALFGVLRRSSTGSIARVHRRRAPRGGEYGDPESGQHGSTLTTSVVCGRQGRRRQPVARPGRTVTAGGQRLAVMRERLLMRESLRRV
jgi:hypothetical protein